MAAQRSDPSGADIAEDDSSNEKLPRGKVWSGQSRQATPTSPLPAPQGIFAPGAAGPLIIWLREHWFYVVSAISLALAGLFSAQHAIESGWLQPPARIVLALLFGGCLIAAGEYIRRRFGDHAAAHTAYLPSVFSGAGLVTLFGAILTAHTLYGLITSAVALIGMVGVAALALVLGWFTGPLLAATGIIGATLTPFLVGAPPGNPYLLHAYFALIVLTGLMINALRKWSWLDTLSLALPFFAAAFVNFIGAGGAVPYILFATTLALLAIAIPGGSLVPRHPLPGLSLSVLRERKLPERAIMLAAVTTAAAVFLAIVPAAPGGPAAFMAATGALVILFAACTIWTRQAPGLAELAVCPALGLIALAAMPSGRVERGLSALFETGGVAIGLLVAAGLAMSVLAAWRSLRARAYAAGLWAALAAVIAPLSVIALEIFRAPSDVIGTYPWALVILALASLATLAAERVARLDGPAHRLRAALAALVALSMIALALFVMLSAAALTAALALTILIAAALDDRFDLKPLTLYMQAGMIVILYRALGNPGLGWGLDTSRFDLAIGYGLPVLALLGTLLLLDARTRPLARSVIEAGTAVLGGAALTLMIARLITDGSMAVPFTHWYLGLSALVWMGLVATTLRRPTPLGLRLPQSWPDRLQALPLLLRKTVGLGAAVTAAGFTAAAVLHNPWLTSEPILGFVPLSSLVLAYLLPAIGIALLAWGLPGLSSATRVILHLFAGGLGALYVCLSIAQAWRGAVLTQAPMSEGELWSYTAALLVLGSALLLAALRQRAHLLRRLANAVLIVAIAKVFLIDAPDLTGLMRAASFLLLGLCLAVLAWINRLITGSGPMPRKTAKS